MVRNSELKKDLVELRHRMDLLDRTLVVANPDSPRSAEVFDGLRKTIIHSLKASQILWASLAQVDQVAADSDDVDMVRAKISELLGQAGVQKLYSYEAQPSAFDRVGEGPVARVVKPAYVVPGELSEIARGVVELSEPAEEKVSKPVEVASDRDEEVTINDSSDAEADSKETNDEVGDAK